MIFLDAEKYIAEAIESVVNQNYTDWELLLIDDGSSDKSSDLALRYSKEYEGKIKYLSHERGMNLGMSASRNLGISEARGHYVAFLDSDDVWQPAFLSEYLNILRHNSESKAVIGSTYYWYSWNQETNNSDFCHPVSEYFGDCTGPTFPPQLLLNFLRAGGAAPVPCSVMVDREVLKELGGFENTFKGLYEDQVFFVKLMLNTNIFVTQECLSWYRQHAESICATENRVVEAKVKFLLWLRRYLESKGYKNSELARIVKNQLLETRRPNVYSIGQKWKRLLYRLKI